MNCFSIRLSSLRASAALLGFLAFSAGSARAQSTNDGSIYSRYGLGELRGFPSAQIQALGGGGTAISNYSYLNLGNPGTWSDQALTRFSAGFMYQGLRASDAADSVSTLSEGTLNAFQFSFPILRQRLGFALSYDPYSRVSYRVQEQGLLDPDPVVGDTNRYVLSYEGSGGLQRVSAGFGYRFNRYVAAGASVNFLFGIVEDARRTTFTSGTYQETYLATSTRLGGATGTVGLHGTIPNLTTKNDALLLGAAVTLPASLRGRRVRTLSTDEQRPRDTLAASVRGDLTLPLSARFGAAYVAEERWLVAADALYEPWSQFESDLAFAGYTPNGASLVDDRLRLSGGVEHLPAGRDLQRSYLARVAYRLGLYYDRSYVAPLPDQRVSTLAVSGGFGLPTAFPGTRLDLGVELGTRGSTDGPLVQDRFLRLSASLNFGERWFEQRRLR